MDKLPFYQKFSLNLISVVILSITIYYGQDMLVPLLFAILLATLLLPVTNLLAKKGFPRTLSILLPIFLSITLGGAILYFLSSQILNFTDDLPAIQERMNDVGLSIQRWIKENTHMTIWKQNLYIQQTLDNLKEKAPQLASQTIGSLTGIITYITLLPIYTFLILYYRSVIKAFLVSTFKNGSEDNVKEILTESTTISQHYMIGQLFETILVFALNTIGFLILGIKYAIFLALVAAILNLIPYVGLVIANILCMFITLINSEMISDVVWVGVILAIVQFIDNNIGMPLLVGSKVKINGLVTIIGILVGGELCGVSGMFLSIPALAVAKVICDRVNGLESWGKLLGDGSDHVPAEKRTIAVIENK